MPSHVKFIALFVAVCFFVVGLADDGGVNVPVNKVMIEARDGQISTVTITDNDCSRTSTLSPMTVPGSQTSVAPILVTTPMSPLGSGIPAETPITSEAPVPSSFTVPAGVPPAESTPTGSSSIPAGPVETSPPVPVGGSATVTINTCVGCPSSTEVPGESSPTGSAGVTTPGGQTSEQPSTPAVQSTPRSSSFATVPTTISSTPTSTPSTPPSNGASSLKGVHAVGLALAVALLM